MTQEQIQEHEEIEGAAVEQEPSAPESEEQKEQDFDDDMRVLEALMFASAEPLSTNAIRERMGDDKDVGGLLLMLKERYSGAGINLVEMDGCWAFRTAQDLGDALQITKEVQRKLSRAAMETLAIVAYHQPVTRAEIENIRGVATNKGTLDVLMECGWVKPGRRRESPGRPLTWLTTTAFMDHFGLESMNDLPGLDDLKASGLLDRRPAIDTIPTTGEMFDEDAENLEGVSDGDDSEEESFREFEADSDEEVEENNETEIEREVE